MSVCLADRVEQLRRQLAVNSNTSAQDMESIQSVELLGEGTFGKVYKGLWRGSTVAVRAELALLPLVLGLRVLSGGLQGCSAESHPEKGEK
jgi:hypothetical protein